MENARRNREMQKFTIHLTLTTDMTAGQVEEWAASLIEEARDHIFIGDHETLELDGVNAPRDTPARRALREAQRMHAAMPYVHKGQEFIISDDETVYSATGEIIGSISTRGAAYVVAVLDEDLNEVARARGTSAVDPDADVDEPLDELLALWLNHLAS
jgi:hypothetical protein